MNDIFDLFGNIIDFEITESKESENKPVPQVIHGDPICIHPSCLRVAYFGDANDKIKTHCGRHKTKQSKNLDPTRRQRSRAKKCVHQKCRKNAYYGYPENRLVFYCRHHREDGMIDLYHKLCVYKGCDRHPCFGYAKRTHCSKHSKPDMINLTGKNKDTS